MSAEPTRIRVLSIDDHPLLRQGIGALVDAQPDMVLVGQAATGQEGVEQFRAQLPDVTLLDLRLPDMSGVDTLRAIRAQFPEARVVMLTTFEGDVEMQRALEAGARGYLLKTMPPASSSTRFGRSTPARSASLPRWRRSSRSTLSDEALTPREIEVLRHIAEGNRNKDIAERLFISEGRQGARQTRDGQAGRERPYRGRLDRDPPRHHPALSSPKGLARASPRRGFAQALQALASQVSGPFCAEARVGGGSTCSDCFPVSRTARRDWACCCSASPSARPSSANVCFPSPGD